MVLVMVTPGIAEDGPVLAVVPFLLPVYRDIGAS
jgi:hypothetical protein